MWSIRLKIFIVLNSFGFLEKVTGYHCEFFALPHDMPFGLPLIANSEGSDST